jgi:SSS family solute:Na+ symporter
MVSVAVLDYIQFVVLSISLVIASVLSVQHLGWTNIVETVQAGKGVAGFDPFHEAGFGWSYVLWMFFLGLVSCAIWQTAVIRACSAKSTKIVKQIYVLSSIGFLIRFLIPYFFGIAAFVFIFNTPALRETFLPTSGEADAELSLLAMPFYLSRILPSGFIGIICAGMLAAFMSTHDSYLLCWSSVLTQDVVAPWFKKGLSSKARLLLTRIFIVSIGLFILVWGLWYPLGQDLWDYMAISGAIYSIGGFALLAFGLYWKRASRVGAYLSLLSAFLVLLGLTPVQNLFSGVLGPVKRALNLAPDETISSAVVGLAVLVTAIVLMVVGSLLFPDKRQNSYHAEREEA